MKRQTKALYGDEAREVLMKGVDLVFHAVAPTMGAKGRNAIYKQYGMPIVTNDGVSIARQILPEDEYESIGAESIKQASEQTNFVAGDGTTSTIVLGRNIFKIGGALIAGGYNPMMLRKEIEIGTEKIVAALKNQSVDVENLEQVAQVSVENDKIAKIVSDTITEVGTDGAVEVIEAPGKEVRVETVKGYTWNTGYTSPYMMTNAKGEAVLEDCAVLVTDRNMNLNKDLIKLLTEVSQAGYRSLLIVAGEVEGELLATLLANKKENRITTVVVKRLDTVHEMEDIAALTGADAAMEGKNITELGIIHTGIAKRVVVTNERTIIIGDDKYTEAVDERIKEVKAAIKEQDSEKYGEIEVLNKRLSRLVGGIAQIKVSAGTEAEQAYLKMKIDDAVGACFSALEEGIVPGGGTTLRDLVSELDTNIAGEDVLAQALVSPYLQILSNAGIELQDGDVAKNFNVLTGESVKDMMEEGIVDPAKVIRCIIENGVSTAKTLLTTDCIIADIPEPPAPVVMVQPPAQG